MAAIHLFTAAEFVNQAQNEFSNMPLDTTLWIREDNISVYDMNIANRTVRANYPVNEAILAQGPERRHILGLVGGNEVSRLGGNPQDIESDLRGITRPLTKCNERDYQPLQQGQDRIVIQNRKHTMAIDIRPVHLKENQMWAYPTSFAPLPLQKQTCGRPEKY